MLDITPTLIKSYLDSKADDDIIGHARNACACLVVRAVAHAYPEIGDIIVGADSLHYTDTEGLGHDQPLRSDVAAIVDGFDDSGTYDEPITKHDYILCQEAAWLL